MTKRILRGAVVAAAVSALALPAAPASAQCTGTFVAQCIRDLLDEPGADSSGHICVIEQDTIGLYVCV